MHIEKRIPYTGSTFYGYISGNLEFSCYYHYHYHYQYNIVVFYIISSFKFQLRTASTDICFVLAIFRHTCTCTVQNNFLSHLPMRSSMNRDLETRPNQIIRQTFVQTILLTHWPPNQTNFSQSDHQTKPMSVCQTNRPDQTRPPSLSPPISLTFSQHAQPADRMLMSYFWYRSGPFLMGWVKGG